jgi:hypothetical protein
MNNSDLQILSLQKNIHLNASYSGFDDRWTVSTTYTFFSKVVF